jgi:hypothetical protein
LQGLAAWDACQMPKGIRRRQRRHATAKGAAENAAATLLPGDFFKHSPLNPFPESIPHKIKDCLKKPPGQGG